MLSGLSFGSISGFRRRSIRVQVALVALAILVPLLGALAYAFHAERASSVGDAGDSSSQMAALAASGLTQFIGDGRLLLNSIAGLPETAGWATHACRPFLRQALRFQPEYANIAVIDLRGRVVCSAVPQPHANTSVAASPWFRAVRADKRFIVGDPFFGPITHRWVSVLAVPMYRAGRLSGYLALPVDLARYQRSLRGASLVHRAVISVVDSTGVIVARSTEANRWVGRRIPDFRAITDGKPGLRRGADGVLRVVAARSVAHSNWTVYAGIPKSEAFAPSVALGWRLVIAGLIASVLGTAGAVFLALGIIRPIRRLASSTEQFAHGDKTSRARVDGPSEIATAAHRFNELVEAWNAADMEQQRLTSQLMQAQKMEAVGQLAGGIAHDFNNLIQAICGYGELALGELAPEDEALRAHVQQMVGAGARAASLTQQLLAYSRQQTLHPHVLDLNEEVRDLEKLLRRVLPESIEIDVALQPELWLVKADAGQIGQVVLNLAVNARDVMPTGGTLTVSTENVRLFAPEELAFWAIEEGDYIRLTVSDTGPGVPREVRPNVFEPFFTTKAVGEGTGLGLSTVYGIVKQSGGHIQLADTDRGATFHIHLPRTDEPLAAVVVVAPADESQEVTETILVVEDDATVRKLVTMALTTLGYTVLQAANPTDALVIAESEMFDLLLTDVVMPAMSGYELARQLSHAQPELRTVFTSGYPDRIGPAANADEASFLQKPYPISLLASTIRHALAVDDHLIAPLK